MKLITFLALTSSTYANTATVAKNGEACGMAGKPAACADKYFCSYVDASALSETNFKKLDGATKMLTDNGNDLTKAKAAWNKDNKEKGRKCIS